MFNVNMGLSLYNSLTSEPLWNPKLQFFYFKKRTRTNGPL